MWMKAHLVRCLNIQIRERPGGTGGPASPMFSCLRFWNCRRLLVAVTLAGRSWSSSLVNVFCKEDAKHVGLKKVSMLGNFIHALLWRAGTIFTESWWSFSDSLSGKSERFQTCSYSNFRRTGVAKYSMTCQEKDYIPFLRTTPSHTWHPQDCVPFTPKICKLHVPRKFLLQKCLYSIVR